MKRTIIMLLSVLICWTIAPGITKAASAGEIDASVDATLASFYNTVKDGKKLVASAKGVLVFPSVYKAGVFFLGGEHGEGSLRMNGRTVDYYSTTSGSFGWQLGVQKKAIIMLFMQDDVLNNLRTSSNWKAGVNASVAVITAGLDGSVDTEKLNKPIIAFVIDQKGLMYNLTLEGTKINKIRK